MSRDTEKGRLEYNAYMRAYRKRPDRVAKETARKQAWIDASPENKAKHQKACNRAQRRKRWGSPDEYAARLAKQGGLCVPCVKNLLRIRNLGVLFKTITMKRRNSETFSTDVAI